MPPAYPFVQAAFSVLSYRGIHAARSSNVPASRLESAFRCPCPGDASEDVTRVTRHFGGLSDGKGTPKPWLSWLLVRCPGTAPHRRVPNTRLRHHVIIQTATADAAAVAM